MYEQVSPGRDRQAKPTVPKKRVWRDRGRNMGDTQDRS